MPPILGNPLIPQGTLNRVRASIIWTLFPTLNVTASFLGRNGISVATDGKTTTQIGTMAGTVTSPEPYQPILMSINLLKTQGLAVAFEQQRQFNSLLGSATLRLDAPNFPPYNYQNCAIDNVDRLVLNGEDAGYLVTVSGFYVINNSLWNS